jgi:hypothetical protein
VLEAVFSSTGFRIRAAQGQAADHELAHHGIVGFAERAAATLFFSLFPSDCRCGSPLINVSVPLQRRKQAQGGLKQAEMIALEALKHASGPGKFAGRLLRRRENLRDAFAVSDPTRILNRDILLVDDVFATGTSASACSRVLRRAGKARVCVATVARMLKISSVLIRALPEDLSQQAGKDRVGVAAHG